MTGTPLDPPEVIQLIQDCREKPFRQQAWERFHHRYHHVIQLHVNLTARTVPVQDRQDLCQKIWLRMPKILESFDPTKNTVAGFLKVVTRHSVMAEWRRASRERAFIQPIEEALLELAKESPEQQNSDLLRILIMDYLVNNVSDHKKLRIYEDWIEGQSYTEIMRRHSVSRAVVFRRFQECRRLVVWALGIRPRKSVDHETDPNSDE